MCFLCGEPLDKTTNQDHLWPLSQGGMRGWHNKVLTHRKCNSLKGARLPTEEELARFMAMTGSNPARHRR